MSLKLNKSRTYVFVAIPLLFLVLLSACSAIGGDGSSPDSSNIEEALDNFVPAISASGVAVPVEWAILSAPTSATVQEIFVEENGRVEEGDILLRLSGSERAKASQAAAELELVAAQQAMDDLIEKSDLVTARSLEEYEEAKRDFNNIITVAPQVDIDQAFANMILAEERVDKAEDDFEPYANKPEDNLERANLLSRLSQARDQYNDAVRKFNAFNSPGNETDIAIAQAELELARIAYEAVKDGPDPDALDLAQARLNNAMALLESANALLNDLEIKAPFAATVTQVLIEENAWVSPGQRLVALGDLSGFHVETTDLNEVDVTKLQMGQTASVSFDSMPAILIEGEIIGIAAKSTPGEGVNYKVTVKLANIPEGLLWDMSALVDFVINESN